MKLWRLAVVLLFVAALPAGAASFDCARAKGKIEKAICASKELSALDSELQRIYTEVLKASRTPDAVRASQKRWLKERRNECGYDACLAAAYRARIAGLRLHPTLKTRMFGLTPLPKSVFGKYAESHEKCYRNDEETREAARRYAREHGEPEPQFDDDEANVCYGEYQNFVKVTRRKDGLANVEIEVNGYSTFCELEGVGEWDGERLLVVSGDTARGEADCVVYLEFGKNSVSIDDPDGGCHRELCGGRTELGGEQYGRVAERKKN